MAIDDYKVTNAEVQAAHVQAAPNTLTGTAQENKAVFDGYPELLKEKHNGLIDELDDALSEIDIDLDSKVDKEEGKGLSTNDFTDELESKLNGIEDGAEVNVQADWNQSDSNADDYIKNKPTIKKGAGTDSIIENDTNNIASGSNSHAEGYRTEASGVRSHAEGSQTKASGNRSHAEGDNTEASGHNAHTEGSYTKAVGGNAHAEGLYTVAAGLDSHAEGIGSIADGDNSHAQGRYTRAKGDSQFAFGKYNIADDQNTYAEIVGNGTDNSYRSNARTLDWNGNEVLAGKLTVGIEPENNKDVATKGYVDTGLAGKVDKVTGKGLSTEDYTTSEKAKLSNIEAGAEVNVQADWETNDTNSDAYIKNKPTLPTKTSDLTNDSDYTTKQYVDGKLPIGKASGSIASVKDGADGMPIKSLTATIVPKQSGSGTPSPDNIRPISGWTEVETVVSGVNVWDEEWEIGLISASTGQNETNSNYSRTKNYCKVVPDTNYYIKNTPSPLYLREYGANKEYIRYAQIAGNNEITIPSDVYYIRFCWDGTTYNNGISINYPSTDHDYHATTATTHTTSLGRTVYGGTVDVVRGTLTVTWLSILGTAWTQYNASNGYKAYRVTNVPKAKFGVDGKSNMISEYGSFNSGAMTKNIIQLADNTGTTYMALDESISPSDVQLIYTLDTPQTYTLTPQQINTLSGVNNVWADSGNVTIEYVRDIGLALDNLLPDSPTTDGTYTLVCTVSDGKATIAWRSSGASLSSPLSMSSPASLNINTTKEEGDSNEIR